MDTQHTPGPWAIIPARPYAGDDESSEGFEEFAGIEGADGNPVCLFGDMSGSGTMFENQADYHLIAAAPDLLAALKRLADVSDAVAELVNCGIGDEAISHARSVIAKAEGR